MKCFRMVPYAGFVMAEIRIGSRGSELALWQANHVARELRAHGHTVEIEIIRTTGDRMQQPGFVPPPGLDGKGIFIKEIEDALAAGRIDLAVHSLKDLPTELDARFALTAIPPRADARDAWVCEPYWALHTLPEGGKIGTTSPRRRAQILALRPDVEFVALRGNVDTRLRKLEAGAVDALVLAAAGLDRLERTEWVHLRFAVDELTPAPGQGALGLETRSAGARARDRRDGPGCGDSGCGRAAGLCEDPLCDGGGTGVSCGDGGWVRSAAGSVLLADRRRLAVACAGAFA